MSTTIERLEGEARERLICWIRHRMDEFGITLAALAQSLDSDFKEQQAVAYRDAWGNTWNGRGDLPEWLQRAVAAGQSIEHFRCSEST
ncbi:H-NS histone family protein [Paraburkholderia sp. BCC1885]|uniref:H-NS histone family protein n=1 Tax=Paraburkholderia sp. BCC1885 TaxID=2562669 RepID=UPI0011823131|nr:H-NS histone family protein [Paraburkholderia sp. BCC1885]